MAIEDHPLFELAAAVSDRAPNAAASPSEGIRLLDRIIRVFGAHATDTPEPRTQSLFSWGTLEVKRSLGAGAFGEVFAAWDPTLRREVALKLRAPEVGALRWLDEARNLARVRHPNVLTVHGADVREGRAGIWTELVSGRTLEEVLARDGPFSQAEALRIASDIASALSAVHAAGLVHGDVKTANIMLEDGEAPRRAVLVDFGTADRMLESGEIPAYLVGTPLTMAPEVLDGQPATGASDVYGLGATLFRLLTGRYPVEANNIDELKRAHASGKKASLREHVPNASPRLSRVLMRALETAPANRWPSAKAFRRALEDIVDPTRRIRARAAAISAGVVAVAAVIVVAILIARPGPGPIARAALSTPHTPGILKETWRRSPAVPRLGWSGAVAVLDMDGDGFDDMVATETRWVGGDGIARGRVLMFRGSRNGLDAEAAFEIHGDAPERLFGDFLADGGDINADGFDDLLLTTRSGMLPEQVTRVQLYLGGPRDRALLPSWTITSANNESWLGSPMTTAGDVNNDGYGDVLVGDGLADNGFVDEGNMCLYLGSPAGLALEPAWTVWGGQTVAYLGTWTKGAGDINADGYDDIVVGATMWDGAASDCGQARVYLGNATGAGAEPVWTFEGGGVNSRFSNSVGGAGDVNHDGYADIVIGEPRYSDEGRPERGRVLLFLGGPNGPSREPDWQALGPVAYMHFGFVAFGVGDIDRDGFDDIAIGAPQYTEGKRVHLGVAEVYRGGPNGCEATATWRTIGDTDSHLGQMIWSGDFNGDRLADLIINAPEWGDSIPQTGLLLAYLAQRPSQ